MLIKKITSAILAVAMVASMSVTVFASEGENPQNGVSQEENLNGFNSIQEDFERLDVDAALENGVYSEDGIYLFYDNSMFVTADIIKAQTELEKASATASKQTFNARSLRYAFELQSSGIFYSRGSQHILGRVTLNPGGTGSFAVGATAGIDYSTTAGIGVDIISLSVGSSYSQSYTLTATINLVNEASYTQTAVLSSVFMVHDFATYDRGFWGNEYNYIGISEVYEPYSSYVFWERN